MQNDQAPWYQQKIFWLLMAGPIIVVIAALYTFYLAQQNANDLVSDDYYKDGKHINLTLERDQEAEKRGIDAQIFINEEQTGLKVFVKGDFDQQQDLRLLFLHPAQKALDQTIELKRGNAPQSGDKVEYNAQINALPKAIHWYVRLEDLNNQWRVETKWLPSQGSAIHLTPIKTILHQN